MINTTNDSNASNQSMLAISPFCDIKPAELKIMTNNMSKKTRVRKI